MSDPQPDRRQPRPSVPDGSRTMNDEELPDNVTPLPHRPTQRVRDLPRINLESPMLRPEPVTVGPDDAVTLSGAKLLDMLADAYHAGAVNSAAVSDERESSRLKIKLETELAALGLSWVSAS